MLLDRAGRTIPDRWVRAADDATPPESGPVILSLAGLAAAPTLDRPGALGVALAPGAELEAVVGDLRRLALVVVPFPGFRDGRGFSAARALRERHHFAGEIRAAGPLLPDQFVALLRVGIDTVELPDGSDPAPWVEALRLSGAFGHSSHPLPWIRRSAIPFEAT